MRKTIFTSGDWNFICESCGFKRKASQGVERWDGLMVCKPTVKAGCWETRHPQELIRPIPDNQKLPWTRPEGTDQFITVTFTPGYPSCSVEGVYPQADFGEADCAEVGRFNPGFIL